LIDIGFSVFGFLTDFGYGFGFSDSDQFGFSDTGRLILYQSTSASKVACSAISYNRKITLFLGYGFYLRLRRITNQVHPALICLYM
jgi:hypothetical protein